MSLESGDQEVLKAWKWLCHGMKLCGDALQHMLQSQPCAEIRGAEVGQSQAGSGPDLMLLGGVAEWYTAGTGLLGTGSTAGSWLCDCNGRGRECLPPSAARVHAGCAHTQDKPTSLLVSAPTALAPVLEQLPPALPAHRSHSGHGRSRSSAESPSPVQVCASYKYRMDLSSAARVPGLLGRARLLTRSEACSRVRLQLRLHWH